MSERYAIVEAGGFQLRVREGETVRVQKLAGKIGGKVTFGKVLLFADDGKVKVGLPYVAGAKVEAQIVGAGKEKKVIVAQFKRRKKVRKLKGHRQSYTEIKVLKLLCEEKTKEEKGAG